ncbi:hypothetical protein EDB85DRAFT_1893755 [Lactarius pseudohatsudake]|nr:hypothetical protein EDB85DRAFT_1893755 [Lactarius pseudohatsudake]
MAFLFEPHHGYRPVKVETTFESDPPLGRQSNRGMMRPYFDDAISVSLSAGSVEGAHDGTMPICQYAYLHRTRLRAAAARLRATTTGPLISVHVSATAFRPYKKQMGCTETYLGPPSAQKVIPSPPRNRSFPWRATPSGTGPARSPLLRAIARWKLELPHPSIVLELGLDGLEIPVRELLVQDAHHQGGARDTHKSLWAWAGTFARGRVSRSRSRNDDVSLVRPACVINAVFRALPRHYNVALEKRALVLKYLRRCTVCAQVTRVESTLEQLYPRNPWTECASASPAVRRRRVPTQELLAGI